jgi:hypothetical protein
MTTWIEPPPPQERKGLGCFAKGCLILIAFVILLGAAFAAGTYFAVRFLRSEYFPAQHIELPASTATPEEQAAVRARWDVFEAAAHTHQLARIEMTADELNALIASEPKLRGKAQVAIEGDVAHLRVSVPLDAVPWLRGHYVNGECTVQSGAGGNPADARVSSIIVNGRPMGEELLGWQWRSWSLRRYMSDWSNERNLDRLEITGGKVVLETKGGS